MNLNYAHFACKEVNLQAMQTNLPTRGAKEPYYIAESIELPEAEWIAFTKGFCIEWPWLKDFNGRLYGYLRKAPHIKACLLVEQKGASSGIAVNTQGYGYARYTTPYSE